jgi:predicted Zn-dependent peptidase
LCLISSLQAYDLSQVTIKKLQNGLTVMVLEDHAQPLVSTQVLYKVGGRNECVGKTGLAHFMEHMSFRATKNFPDTQDAIYAVGGEWHGYTWIDETTYFETVPIQHLDTVLRLQADRMHNVLNRAEEVEAERGAVLTELHSYENDPATVLYDQVLAVSFLEHPYRYNVIGWTSDVEKIQHDDLVDFYENFYTPSNAVLAVAGDVEAAKLFPQIEGYFGNIASRKIDTLPRTVEPLQKGERRVYLRGSGKLHYYQITYHAPGAPDPDYPAFLLLQAILAGSNGVSFRQSGFSVDVPEGTRLAGIGTRITTFFAPTAQPYVLNFAGTTEGNPDEIEKEIEKRIAIVRQQRVPQKELDQARKQFLAELVFDIETTEDAAHQMAYFEGIGAFPVLQKLPNLIQAVTPADIQRVAAKYLGPEQRTIGWFLGDGSPVARSSFHNSLAAKKDDTSATAIVSRSNRPVVDKTKNGIGLIVQKMTRSPAAFLRILIPTNTVENWSANQPVWRFTSLQWRFLKEDLAATLKKARMALDTVKTSAPQDSASQDDPETRLDLALEAMVGSKPYRGNFHPVVISLVGDIDVASSLKLLKKTFADPQGKLEPVQIQLMEKSQLVRIPGKAQSQFGYAVLAPAPSSVESYAYRALLYIMTHAYGGRLGKELINRRGLIYYISNNYNSDGKASWISIRFGVNPDQLDETKKEFERLMQELRTNPPTEKELAEAKEHLIGRRITAYQSNDELTAFYTREWIEHGWLMNQEEFEKTLSMLTLDQVKRIIPRFLDGASVTVDTR